MPPWFCIGDFIGYTEALFEGILLTAGYKYKVGGEEKYQLGYARLLRDYVIKYKKGKSPIFTSNDIECYLNRCRFYIYNEKRADKFIDKDGKEADLPEVDSAEVFSVKCVRLFFELSGINFHFLRMNPADENSDSTEIDFRSVQQQCLDNLFETTIHYLCHAERKNIKLTISELVSLWKILYREYRYKLFKKSMEKIESPENLFLSEEMMNYLSAVTQAYYDMKRLGGMMDNVEDDEVNYIVGRDEEVQNLKAGCDVEFRRLKKLESYIKNIIDADDFQKIQKEIPWLISPEELEDFNANCKVDSNMISCKNYLLDKLIQKFYSSRKNSFLASVMYMENFEETIKEYTIVCDAMWKIITEKEHVQDALFCLTGENIYRLITELDETYWLLNLQNGNLYNN